MPAAGAKRRQGLQVEAREPPATSPASSVSAVGMPAARSVRRRPPPCTPGVMATPSAAAIAAASSAQQQVRKPRSFETAGSPKQAPRVRRPRSFGAEGWLRVELPAESPDTVQWYRRVRNLVTTSSHHKAGGSNHSSNHNCHYHGCGGHGAIGVTTAGFRAPDGGGAIGSSDGNQPATPALLRAVAPGLYVGDKYDAANIELLRQRRITHVLNCASEAETGTSAAYYLGNNNINVRAPIVYLELGATEGDGAELLQPFLHTVAQFVDQACSAGGAVLMHCVAGINRSCALCIGCVRSHQRMPSLPQLPSSLVDCWRVGAIITGCATAGTWCRGCECRCWKPSGASGKPGPPSCATKGSVASW